MNPNRPSYLDGRLHIPSREGRYASLVLANSEGNHFASQFRAEIEVPGILFASAVAVRSDYDETISHVWKDVPFERHQKGTWGGWATDCREFTVDSVIHDGLGHYEMAVSILPLYSFRQCKASAVVMLEAGWLPDIARWWADFFFANKN